MHYPVPTNAEIYFQSSYTAKKNKDNNRLDSDLSNNFSRSKKCKYMDEYLDKIRNLESIFKSIPFVEQIFLCNSITFNALDDNSDIDLFIIATPGRIWSVKLRSMLLFSLKGVKRFGSSIRKKICLSFFITSDNQNLYPISLSSIDIYLCYWITHLVPIYQSNNNKQTIYSHNKWIKGVLPNFQEKQTIFLGIEPFSGNTKFKSFIEFIGKGVLGDICEMIAKYIQKFVIKIKILLNPDKNKNVIISDSMLKFHQDIREKISLLYNVKIK